MPISPLPTPPTREDAANFSARADALVAALPTFVVQANELAADVNADAQTATDQAEIATNKAAEASDHAGDAAASAAAAATFNPALYATLAGASYTGDVSLTAAAGAERSLKFYRATSGSGIGVGIVQFDGNDAGGNRVPYAQVQGVMGAGTVGAQNGRLNFRTVKAGALTDVGQWDENGVFRINNIANLSHVGNNTKLQAATSGADYVAAFQNTGVDPYGVLIKHTADYNNAANPFFACRGASSRLEIWANGGIANYSANNTNLSDEREKPHIESFDAEADLEAFLVFPFFNYKYCDQTHDDWNLGTGAQSALASHPDNERYVDLDSWQKPMVDADGQPVMVPAFDADGQPVMEETGLLGPDEQPIMRQAKKQATESRMSVYDGDLHYRTGAQAQYAHRRIAVLEQQIAEMTRRLNEAGIG